MQSIGSAQSQRRFAIALLAFFAAFFVAMFQNCSGFASAISVGESRGSGAISSLTAQGGGGTGNGDGYQGKPYINVSTTMPCDDGSFVRSRVVVNDGGTAAVTRENCKEVAPRPVSVSNLQLLPHNKDNVVHNGRAFDRETENQPHTAVICRSGMVSVDGVPLGGVNSSMKYTTDNVLYSARSSGRWVYSAYGKYGAYDASGGLVHSSWNFFPQINVLKEVGGQAVPMNQESFGYEDAVAWGSTTVKNQSQGSPLLVPTSYQLYYHRFGNQLKGMAIGMSAGLEVFGAPLFPVPAFLLIESLFYFNCYPQ